MQDIFLIVLTAFAVLGLFSLGETVSRAILAKHLPHSVTFIEYGRDDMTYQKYKSLIFNVYNNDIVFVGEGDNNIYPETYKISRDKTAEFMQNNLFTNQDN